MQRYTERRTPPASPHTVYEDMRMGAAVGVLAGFTLSWVAEGSLLLFQFLVVFGAGIGAIGGLMLWIGSLVQPEEKIIPPRSGQRRGRIRDTNEYQPVERRRQERV